MGWLLACGTVIAVMSGLLFLDAHGFGLIMFGQAIWLISAGIFLMPAVAGSAALRSTTPAIS